MTAGVKVWGSYYRRGGKGVSRGKGVGRGKEGGIEEGIGVENIGRVRKRVTGKIIQLEERRVGYEIQGRVILR